MTGLILYRFRNYDNSWIPYFNYFRTLAKRLLGSIQMLGSKTKTRIDTSSLLVQANAFLLVVAISGPVVLLWFHGSGLADDNRDWRSEWYALATDTEEPSRLRDLVSGCLNFSAGQDTKIRNVYSLFRDYILGASFFVGLFAFLNLAIAIEARRKRNAT